MKNKLLKVLLKYNWTPKSEKRIEKFFKKEIMKISNI